jgi:hypothetical protein
MPVDIKKALVLEGGSLPGGNLRSDPKVAAQLGEE